MKKTLLLLIGCILSVVSVSAKGWGKDYRAIEKRIVAPVFPDRKYIITDFGATPEGKAADNQRAINSAIATCSQAGGGSVIVP